MTTPPEAAPMREDVTQADKDALQAAWDEYASWMGDPDVKDDSAHAFNQAAKVIARHRLAHTARPDAEALPQKPEGTSLFAVNCETGAWHYVNHANTWQGMPNPLSARPDAGDGYVLPCDIHLPPATVIKAGCPLSTLKLAMEADYRPRHFEGNPRYSVPDAGDDVERAEKIAAVLFEFDTPDCSWADWLVYTEQHSAKSFRGMVARYRAKGAAVAAAMREGVDRGMVEEQAAKLEAIGEFVDDYLSPWGSWKTVWWEGEVSDDAAFTDENALKHVANIARRPLAQGRVRG